MTAVTIAVASKNAGDTSLRKEEKEPKTDVHKFSAFYSQHLFYLSKGTLTFMGPNKGMNHRRTGLNYIHSFR